MGRNLPSDVRSHNYCSHSFCSDDVKHSTCGYCNSSCIDLMQVIVSEWQLSTVSSEGLKIMMPPLAFQHVKQLPRVCLWHSVWSFPTAVEIARWNMHQRRRLASCKHHRSPRRTVSEAVLKHCVHLRQRHWAPDRLWQCYPQVHLYVTAILTRFWSIACVFGKRIGLWIG